jgi:hypothetical protein
VLVGGLLFDIVGKTVSFLAVAAFGLLLAIPAIIALVWRWAVGDHQNQATAVVTASLELLLEN